MWVSGCLTREEAPAPLRLLSSTSLNRRRSEASIPRSFEEYPHKTPNSNHPNMVRQGFDASYAGMDNKGASIHFPGFLGTSASDGNSDIVILSRKEASRKCSEGSASSTRVSRNESRFDTASTNFLRDRLDSCTEELGAESFSHISEDLVSRPNTCFGKVGQDIVRSRGISIPRVVNMTNFCARSLPLEAEADYGNMKNAENLMQEKNDARRDWRGETSRISGKFPPPISSLTCKPGHTILQPYKTNGRFVLRKIEYPCPKIFRARRRDGRLKLELLSPLVEDGGYYSSAFTSFDEEARPTTKVEQPGTRKEMGKGSYCSAAEEILGSPADNGSIGKGKDSQSHSNIRLLVEIHSEMEASFQLLEETLPEQEIYDGAASNAENILRADLGETPETDTSNDGTKLARVAPKASCFSIFYAGFMDALLLLDAYFVQRFSLGQRKPLKTRRGNLLKPRANFELLFATLSSWQPAETRDAWEASMMNELPGPKRKACAHQLQDMVMTENSWARLQNVSVLVCRNKSNVNFHLCAMYSWKDLSLSSSDEKVGAAFQRIVGAEPL